MRILHVLDHGLPLQSGYTFRTRAILKAQEARGWQVAAVTGPRHGLAPDAVESVDGLTFYRTQATRKGGVLGEVGGLAAFARRIDAAVDAFRPDMLHAHSPVLDAIAALRVARARGLPLVYEIRAFWEDAAVGNGTGTEGSAKYRVTRAMESWAVQRADAVAVICEGLRGDLIARGVAADKIVVSPNGVDLTLFGEPVARDPALAASLGLEDAETIGFIGSFYDYEGLDDLIAAMPALVTARPRRGFCSSAAARWRWRCARRRRRPRRLTRSASSAACRIPRWNAITRWSTCSPIRASACVSPISSRR